MANGEQFVPCCMQRLFLILFFNFTLIACMDSTRYQYADGSANLYIITPDSLEYVPVKPEASSTGMYSGGDPKKVALKPETFRNVRALLETAKKNHAVHIPDRIKTSGMITTLSGDKETHLILKPGCEEITNIENELKKLLGN